KETTSDLPKFSSIPTENIRLFLTFIEEGLRKYVRNRRIFSVGIEENLGKSLVVSFSDFMLRIVLFGSYTPQILSQDGEIIWSGRKFFSVPELKKPLTYIDPEIEDPFDWQKEFFQGKNRKLHHKKEKIKKNHLNYLERKIETLSREIPQNQKEAQQLREKAELIRANLYLCGPSVKKDILKIYDFSGKESSLSLDPRFTTSENMKKFFSRAKRLERGVEKIRSLLKNCRMEKNELEKTPVENILLPETSKKKQGSGRHTPFHKYVSREGDVFLVGKNAKDNDTLTLKKSAPSDYWFHAAGIPGSHVIMRSNPGSELTDSQIFIASVLALHYSGRKKTASGEVMYTRCRNVTKKKGAAPGVVNVCNEKTVHISYDEMSFELLKKI
ncbi:MAG: NFACT RNA binding domain-containing protein, partial [bacterium]